MSISPQIGEFQDGRGEFYAQDTLNGKVIYLRYAWSNTTTNTPHWEQAFSNHGGKTWEVNWITNQTRVPDDSIKPYDHPVDSNAATQAAAARDGPHDFDPLIGGWKFDLKVRQHPLSGSTIIPVEPVVDSVSERTTLTSALDTYKDYVKYHRSLRTFRTYRPILQSFKEFCSKTYVDEIERQDFIDFATHCMKQGQKGKSIYNKLVVLSQVMKQHGRSKLLNTSDWPRFVETVRPIYEDFELAKLFKACAPSEEVRFKFYLMSGFRDAEGRFVTWRDIDFKHMAVRVR